MAQTIYSKAGTDAAISGAIEELHLGTAAATDATDFATAAQAVTPTQVVTLTADLTYSVPASAPTDRPHSVVFTQDEAAGHAVTFDGAIIKSDLDAALPAMPATPGSELHLVLSWSPSRLKWVALVVDSHLAAVGPTMWAPLVTDTTVTIQWDAVAGATGHEVQIDGAAVVAVGTAQLWTFGGLAASTAHTVSVRDIFADASRSPWSNKAATTTAAKTANVADDFTAADGTTLNGRTTPTGGAVWTSPNGNPVASGKTAGVITGNRVTSAIAADGYAATLSVAQADVRVSAAYTLTIGTTPQARVFARTTVTAGTGAGVTAYVRHNGQVFLSIVNGTGVLLASGKPLSGTIALQVQGDVYTVLINGAVVGSRVLTGFAGTLAGFSTYASTSAVDDFKVEYL